MLVYVAGPYSGGDVCVNVSRAMEVGHLVLDAGFVPVVPHLSHFLHLQKARPYEDWIRMDLGLLGRCDCLVRLLGNSPGADGEVDFAGKHGIPVILETAGGWEYRCDRSDRLLSALNLVRVGAL